MPDSPKVRRQLTPRDLDVLVSLERSPLTVEQLLKLSATFAEPFGSAQRVRGRLQAMRDAGWVSRFPYATPSRGGAPDYYKLTLTGYRLLHGADAKPPRKRAFSEIAVGHQHHTKSLADFIVHSLVAAFDRGLTVHDFFPENTLRLPVGYEFLFPDCAFQLRTMAGKRFNFVVELDNSTETVRSEKETEHWQRKISLYDQFQDSLRQERKQKRFRVLVVTTRSRDRLDHILEVAGETVSHTERSLFYGVHLPEFLSQSDPMFTPCFTDHKRRRVAMVQAGKPASVETAEAEPATVVAV